MKASSADRGQVEYRLDPDGCFVVENYNQSKPFSNFFPGIAGVWGIPTWVFYVNRGQGISSFGIESKDKAILEFLPANKAYRQTSLQGFRTFIKVHSGNKFFPWEPFQDRGIQSPFQNRQTMSITSHDLTLEEWNLSLGLHVKVNYFTMPQEDFPALVRRVTVINASRKNYSLEVVDGLPMILPYGMKDWISKNMSRTVEAWVKVKNVENKAPFYHLNVEVADTPSVTHIKEGNFYLSFDPQNPNPELLAPIVEAACVFGHSTDFLIPQTFWNSKTFRVPEQQQTSNRTPGAMSYARFKLAPRKIKEIVSVIGYTHGEQALQRIVKRVTAKGFIDEKARQNFDTVEQVKRYAWTHSASPEFNLYCGQTFLDNALRGGLPISLKTEEGSVAFNVFSRKHGDPERDYNHFVLSPTYFSQGNGNYRDVNQNRRNDVWFNGDVRESSIIDFFNLVQGDGYNPLIVKGLAFVVADAKKAEAVLKDCVKGDIKILQDRLLTGFQPGELLNFVLQKGISLKVPLQKFLERILSVCHKQSRSDHGEGFWSDHWTYNLDLLESFVSLYPEDFQTLLLGKKAFYFYHNSHYILPRDHRYFLTPKGVVRQLHSVKDGTKEIKAHERGNKLRTHNGEGDVYFTTLIVKLLCLAANKAATLDPSGIGVEMEGDKPNWYDALNGLPGLLGSSISETLELKRLCTFLLDTLEEMNVKDDERVALFSELAAFIKELKETLVREKDPTAYWHQANDGKERYRLAVRQGIEGKEVHVSLSEIKEFLNLIVERTTRSTALAKDGKGRMGTYFYHDVVDYALLDRKEGENSCVLPVAFQRHALPLFLEGFVHALRVEKDVAKARELYHAVHTSPLFDKELRMYKVNADLSKESEDIGRTRIFPRGWLENESIWLHMEYKYALELLRCGLHGEFFATFKDVLIPFLDPAEYGRSPLENSSFIASSAHDDVNLHGQGFVARLSGSTAEFLHMWLMMNLGPRPFTVNSRGELQLKLKPALPAWLFTTQAAEVDWLNKTGHRQKVSLPKNVYAFNFLNATLMVYHNPKRRDTFGKTIGPIREATLTYPDRRETIPVSDAIIPSPYAHDLRERKVERMDVVWG